MVTEHAKQTAVKWEESAVSSWQMHEVPNNKLKLAIFT
jgi:hypothetical protein